MRTESEIKMELNATLTEYQSTAQDLTPAKSIPLTARIKELQQELSAFYADAANTCACGRRPGGMLRRPAHMDRGHKIPDLYEVGCPVCAPYLVDCEPYQDVNGVTRSLKRRSYSAIGKTPAEAVANWNAGNWTEDDRL